jgi:two-component system sensor histidine kinase BaeS
VRVPVKSGDEIGELTDTFNQMAASLERQETLRRNLMADVAHELRTPLTGIQGAVEAMQDGVFPADAENLEALHAQVLLLNRLVDDLRTLANAEAGQLRLERAPVDLADLCRRQVSALHLRAAEHGITLTTPRHRKRSWVDGDSQRLNQVLLNLLDNALRHTPAGGDVTVAVRATDDAVFVTVTTTAPAFLRLMCPTSSTASTAATARAIAAPAARGWGWPSPASWWKRTAAASG